jgi:hypothetical protein
LANDLLSEVIKDEDLVAAVVDELVLRHLSLFRDQHLVLLSFRRTWRVAKQNNKLHNNKKEKKNESDKK